MQPHPSIEAPAGPHEKYLCTDGWQRGTEARKIERFYEMLAGGGRGGRGRRWGGEERERGGEGRRGLTPGAGAACMHACHATTRAKAVGLQQRCGRLDGGWRALRLAQPRHGTGRTRRELQRLEAASSICGMQRRPGGAAAPPPKRRVTRGRTSFINKNNPRRRCSPLSPKRHQKPRGGRREHETTARQRRKDAQRSCTHRSVQGAVATYLLRRAAASACPPDRQWRHRSREGGD